MLGRAQCLILLALIEEAVGGFQRGRELLAQARAEFDRIGYRLGIAQCDVALGPRRSPRLRLRGRPHSRARRARQLSRGPEPARRGRVRAPARDGGPRLRRVRRRRGACARRLQDLRAPAGSLGSARGAPARGPGRARARRPARRGARRRLRSRRPRRGRAAPAPPPHARLARPAPGAMAGGGRGDRRRARRFRVSRPARRPRGRTAPRASRPAPVPATTRLICSFASRDPAWVGPALGQDRGVAPADRVGPPRPSRRPSRQRAGERRASVAALVRRRP